MPTKQVKYIGVRVMPEIHAKMAYVAEYEGRTLNGQLHYLMLDCIHKFEKEHGPITGEDIAEQGKYKK